MNMFWPFTATPTMRAVESRGQTLHHGKKRMGKIYILATVGVSDLHSEKHPTYTPWVCGNNESTKEETK